MMLIRFIKPQTANWVQNLTSPRKSPPRTQCTLNPWNCGQYIECLPPSRTQRNHHLLSHHLQHCLQVSHLHAPIRIGTPRPFARPGHIAQPLSFCAHRQSWINIGLHVVVLGGLGLEPWVLEHHIRKNSSLGVAVEHGVHEFFKELSFRLWKFVFGNHYIFQAPILKFWDSDQIAILWEIFFALETTASKLLREPTQKFHHLSEMIIIFPKRIIIVFARVEQKLPCQHFKGHTCQRPHISTQVVLWSC